jgi:carbon storage regulator
MLVLTRKTGEAIRIAAMVDVTVLEIRGGQVKLGVSGPREVPIYREEVFRRTQDCRKDRTNGHIGKDR